LRVLLSLAGVIVVGVLPGRIIAGLLFLLSLFSICLQIQSDRQHDAQLRGVTRNIANLKWITNPDQWLTEYRQNDGHSGQQVPLHRTQQDDHPPMKAPGFDTDK
jgi:hypothetical protein